MDTRWIGIIVFVLVIMATVPLMHFWMQRDPPPMIPLQTIELEANRAVHLKGRLMYNQAQAFYYEVQHHDQVVQPETFFASLPGGSPALEFVHHLAEDGDLVGIAVSTDPYAILAIHDFETGGSWPAFERGESVDEVQARGRAMLEPLQAAHPDKPIRFVHAEATRPLQELVDLGWEGDFPPPDSEPSPLHRIDEAD